VKPDHSATVTLRMPGTYTYYCQFHAFMHGTVIVK
jgi:plastocyanin